MAGVQQIASNFSGTGMVANQFTCVLTGGALVGESSTAESNCASPVRTLGTFSLLDVNTGFANTGANLTVTFRVSAADGNQAVSVIQNTTGETIDSVNTDAPTAGQTVDVRPTTASFTGWEPSAISVLFTATSGTVGRIGNNHNTSFSTGGGFINLGMSSLFTTESDSQAQFVNPCTLQNLAVVCITKGRSKADTVTLRKNSIDGNSTVSITGTGLFEDTVAPFDSIAANDKVNYNITTGSGSGTDNINLVSIEQSSSDSTYQFFNAAGSTGTGIGPALVCGLGLGGTTIGAVAAESNAAVQLQTAGVISLLDVNIPTNTINGSSTITLRKNTANTAVTVSIASTSTGLFEDSTNTASVSIGDTSCYLVSTGGSSGSILPGTIMSLFSPSTGPTAGEMIASTMFGFIQPFPFRTQIIAY